MLLNWQQMTRLEEIRIWMKTRDHLVFDFSILYFSVHQAQCTS